MGTNTFEKSRCMRDILELLKTGMLLTKHNASEKVHCDKRTAERILAHLWLEKMAHIASWDRIYNNTTPRYRIGTGRDIPRPDPQPMIEKVRRYRAKPGVQERINAQNRWKRSLRREVRIGIWGI